MHIQSEVLFESTVFPGRRGRLAVLTSILCGPNRETKRDAKMETTRGTKLKTTRETKWQMKWEIKRDRQN